MARVKVTAEEFQDKHARRLKAATPDMVRGIDRVTQAPGELAAEKVDKWHAKVSAQETKDKYKANVASVPLSEWKSKMKNKGVPRVAGGIDEAKAKVTKFAGQLIAYQEANLGEIDDMADLTLEDGVQRASAWIRKMGEFKFER